MSWLRRQFRTFETLLTCWRESLTAGGKTLTIVLVCCLPSLAALDSPIFLLFWSHCALLIATAVAAHRRRPKFELRLNRLENVRRGDLVDLAISTKNNSSRWTGEVAAELVDAPESWELVRGKRQIPSLEAGESTRFKLRVRPTRRGVFPLPGLRAASTFPFNLVRLWNTYDLGGECLVGPKYHQLDRLPARDAGGVPMGDQRAAVTTAGSGGEYVGSREYVHGMSVRRWDYNSWARLGRPVVREFADPPAPSAAIIVDAFAPSKDVGDRRREDRNLEALLSLAAAICEALDQRDVRLDRLTVGDVDRRLETLGASQRRDAITRTLAEAALCDQVGIAALGDALESSPVGADCYYVLLRRADRGRVRWCEILARRGIETYPIVVDDSPEATSQHSLGGWKSSVQEIEAGRFKFR